MNSSLSPLGQIDYSSISFPSDSVTVATIRRVHPGRFDIEDGRRFRGVQDDPDFSLGTAMYLERLLARAAFETASGGPGDHLAGSGLTRDDCLRDLTHFYRTYGVADGRHQVDQLVRRVETQAADQVRRRAP